MNEHTKGSDAVTVSNAAAPADDAAAEDGASASHSQGDPAQRRDGRPAGFDRRGALDAAPLAVVAVGILIAMWALIYQAKRMWFFGDDWEFLVNRSVTSDTVDHLLEPHNEHWSTVPILVFRALYGMFGVRHYMPYAVMPILVHAAICVLLFLMLRRHGLSRWECVAPTLVIAFLGGGAENTEWAFQIGFTGSVFFGLLAIHQLSGALTRATIVLAAVWATLSLMCSGIGITMLGAASLYALLRLGWQRAVAFAVGPAALFGLWYLTYGRDATTDGDLDWLLLPSYVATGLSNMWEWTTSVAGAGVVILAFMVIAVVRATAPRYSELQVLAFTGLIAALALFLINGIGRVQYGIDQAEASRYVYIGCVLTAPALALGLAMLRDRATTRTWLYPSMVTAITILVAVNGINLERSFRESRDQLLKGRIDQILGGAQLVREGVPLLGDLPEPQFDPDITAEYLSRPSTQRAFPNAVPSDQGVLNAAANLQVAVSTDPLPVPAASAVTVAGAVPSSASGACTVYSLSAQTATITLAPSPDGAAITLDGPITSLITYLTRGGVTSIPVAHPRPTDTVAAGTSAADAALNLRVEAAGPIEVCLSANPQ